MKLRPLCAQVNAFALIERSQSDCAQMLLFSYALIEMLQFIFVHQLVICIEHGYCAWSQMAYS